MSWGLDERAIAAIRQVLAKNEFVERALLYGSRAKGNFKPGSDIDLTLLGDGLDWRLCMAIAGELDELLLPYQIDLSVFSLLTDPALRAHIDRVGVVFYERGTQRKDAGP